MAGVPSLVRPCAGARAESGRLQRNLKMGIKSPVTPWILSVTAISPMTETALAKTSNRIFQRNRDRKTTHKRSSATAPMQVSIV